jgi:hypothetical protein
LRKDLPIVKKEDRPQTSAKKPLPPEAERALAEAAERRSRADAEVAAKPPLPKEIDPPKGPEPTRYGDWERKGIISDF